MQVGERASGEGCWQRQDVGQVGFQVTALWVRRALLLVLLPLPLSLPLSLSLSSLSFSCSCRILGNEAPLAGISPRKATGSRRRLKNEVEGDLQSGKQAVSHCGRGNELMR